MNMRPRQGLHTIRRSDRGMAESPYRALLERRRPIALVWSSGRDVLSGPGPE
jgi:hypothetical protein